MNNSKSHAFSFRWMLTCVGIFIIVELFMTGMISNLALGADITINLRYIWQAFFHLCSFFISGVVIGIFSIKRSLIEPILAAVITVAIVSALIYQTHVNLVQFSVIIMVLGCVLSLMLTLIGLRVGDKIKKAE